MSESVDNGNELTLPFCVKGQTRNSQEGGGGGGGRGMIGT